MDWRAPIDTRSIICLEPAKASNLQRLAAAGASELAVLVEDPAAVLGVAGFAIIAPLAAEFAMDRKTLWIAEIDVTAWANIGSQSGPSLSQRGAILGTTRVASYQPDDALEGSVGLLRPDVVALLVVLVPKPSTRVLLLVAILYQSDPLTLTCVLRHGPPICAQFMGTRHH